MSNQRENRQNSRPFYLIKEAPFVEEELPQLPQPRKSVPPSLTIYQRFQFLSPEGPAL